MGPVELEISASPDLGRLEPAGFQGAVDPAAAAPAGGADIPVGMIVEREHRKRLPDPPLPDGAQVMKIPRAKENKRAQMRRNLRVKALNLVIERRETKPWAPPPQIHRRNQKHGSGVGKFTLEVEVNLIGGHVCHAGDWKSDRRRQGSGGLYCRVSTGRCAG